MASAPAVTPQRPARLRFGAGPLSTEALFLEDLSTRLEGLGPEILVRPVRIVVPSSALRSHLLARVVRSTGRAVAGLHCVTLFGLARGVAERALGATRPHDELSVLIARRFAQNEEWLRRSLAHLTDGYRSVDASIRDLLEAGLESAHVEALEEALAADGRDADASGEEIRRAAALVRVAGATLASLEELGVHSTPTLLRAATDLIRLGPQDLLPTDTLFIYGFNDAIGVATDLLTTLLDRFGGTIYLDRPPDPASPDRPDASNVFTRRFAERISDVARPLEEEPQRSPVELSSFQAIGGEAEIRAVAGEIRALLDAGERPEEIGIVARQLGRYRTPLRTHLSRLGIPFSAFADGPRGPEGRSVQAVLALLRRSGATPVERWLDARARPFPRISDFDLHLALSTIGAGRLEEVPTRPYAAVSHGGRYALPVRRGFHADEDDEVYAQRRKVPLSALESAAEAAGDLLSFLEEWKAERRLARHVRNLRELLVEGLDWSPAAELTRRITSIAEDIQRGVPDEFGLGYDEFFDLLEPALERVGACAFGGSGAGVRVLDVIEARGLTFRHLFVVGLNRGLFPRIVSEDPLLPDSLRAVLSRHGFGVLQDLPQKLTGFDEERYLFSQLLAAAPRVSLSWQEVDEDNRQQAASPLIERLRWSLGSTAWEQPATARHLYSEATAALREGGWRHRPPHEAAVLAGAFGARGAFGKVLAVALEEAAEAAGLPRPPRGLHNTRVRILDEIDPQLTTRKGLRTRRRLGPYFGFLGPPSTGDPRTRERLFVTTLEGITACSWRAFLERLLQLQPVPDPLEALPGAEPIYIGNLVHRVLERIVTSQLPQPDLDLAEARAAGSAVLWPDAAKLEAIVTEEAEQLVRIEGFAFPGFARLMREVVGPYLEVAREVEWAAGPVAAAAAETYGSVEVAREGARSRTISFKADRIDANGAVTLVDYKTGRPLSTKKTETARRQDLLRKVRSGEALQAVAYALAAGEPDDVGRYLYLRPDGEVTSEQRLAEVRGSDADFAEAFHSSVSTALRAWDEGSFLPRLIEGRGEKEFAFCKACRVAESCLRGDSGARGRLRDWLAARAEGADDLSAADVAALETWTLRGDLPSEDRRRRLP